MEILTLSRPTPNIQISEFVIAPAVRGLRAAKGRPARLSSTRKGDFSGLTSAATGTMSVCSTAYWPDKTACGTESVKAIQVDPGGNANLIFRQSC